MSTLQRLEAENKALSIALHVACVALRLNTTAAAGMSPEEDQWPECATDFAVMKKVWAGICPLMGYSPAIEEAVSLLSPHNPSNDVYDQATLMLKWQNTLFAASLASSGFFPARGGAG